MNHSEWRIPNYSALMDVGGRCKTPPRGTLNQRVDSLNRVRQLFFSPRYDLGEKAFELDLYRHNPSRLVQEFQECIGAKD